MSGEYTHCLGRFRHRRTLYCRSTGLTVEDELEGVRQRAIAMLLINGEFEVISSTTNSIEFARQEVRIVLSSQFALSFSKATWSPDFGVKSPATQISIDYGQESGNFGFEFTICSKS